MRMFIHKLKIETLFYFKDLFRTLCFLFKIMIPMIILVKILEEIGLIETISSGLEPLMGVLGLPGEMSLVWATVVLTNLYAGLFILIDSGIELTVAQVSVLGTLLLFTHALPMEVGVSKKMGLPIWASLLIRIGGGFLLAWLQHLFFVFEGGYQEKANMMITLTAQKSQTYLEWAIGQAENLAGVAVLVAGMMLMIRVIKIVKLDRVFAMILAPLLKLLQVGKEAANLAVVGVTLGIVYGSGLILQEAEKGIVTKREILITMLLLNIAHSLIEDTSIVLLMGADFNFVFWSRIVFALTVVAIIARVLPKKIA